MKHMVEDCMARFAEVLRAEALLYRRRGLTMIADLHESIAADAEAHGQAYLDEPLTLALAAETARCGYSTLQHRVALGKLPDAGEKGRPRIRRRHIPIRVDAGVVGLEHDVTPEQAPAQYESLDRDCDPVQVAAMEALAEFEAELRDRLPDDLL